MSGNTFGEIFRVSTFGESHGEAVGVIIDGCPSGLELSVGDIQKELNRRKPGQSAVTTSRTEKDKAILLSGVFHGRSTATPIAIIVHNKDKDPGAYESLKHKPRPNHADFTYFMKYGLRDWRGGGRASGRETVGRVAAGAVAKKILAKEGIEILGHTVEIGGISASETQIEDVRKKTESNPVRCSDQKAAKKMEKAVLAVKKAGDSLGGVVEVLALNVPPGLGEPVFDKLDGELAKALMSIGAVKGVEIGAGFRAARSRGSENNDEFIMVSGKVSTKTNNSGGILGGISNGMPIVIRAAIKPTSSIAKEQRTVDLSSMKQTKIKITGRHDPCIVPRVLPVCEAMTAIVLTDHLLRHRCSRLQTSNQR